jgi:hypothetical protein
MRVNGASDMPPIGRQPSAISHQLRSQRRLKLKAEG